MFKLNGLSRVVLAWFLIQLPGCMRAPRPEASVSTEFADHLAKGELQEAYRLTSRGMQHRQNFQEFEKEVRKYPDLRLPVDKTKTWVQDIDVGSESDVPGYKATVRTSSNGRSTSYSLNLIKENGGVKVDRITFGE